MTLAVTKPYFEKIERGTWENNAFQWIIIPVVFGERDTLDLKVRFVGVITRFGLFFCGFAFFIIIPTVCQNQSAPTAHFPSTELRSSVLFCLNESFRINLFPKSPSQTQKSAIIVACRLSSVRTHGVPYGMWAAHQNDWKCWVFVWFTHLWLGLCIYNLSTPCGFQSVYHSRRAPASVVQFKPLDRRPANQKRAFPEPFCPSRAREIRGGCDFTGQRWSLEVCLGRSLQAARRVTDNRDLWFYSEHC